MALLWIKSRFGLLKHFGHCFTCTGTRTISKSCLLISPPVSSWEGVGYKQSMWLPGTWPEVYFLTGLVMGTDAAVQIQGSHRLTKKHRGQGLTKPREPWCKRSHTAVELLALLAANGRWSESSMDRSEGGFSSTTGLQRPVRAAVRQATPSSHSGGPLHGAKTQFPLRPRGSLRARVHKRSRYGANQAVTP